MDCLQSEMDMERRMVSETGSACGAADMASDVAGWSLLDVVEKVWEVVLVGDVVEVVQQTGSVSPSPCARSAA